MTRNHAVYRRINGVKHKLCTGPKHTDGKYVSFENFYKRGDGTGKLRPWCKECEFSIHNSEPSVPWIRIRFAVEELVFRVGATETARRIGVRTNTLWEWRNGKRKSIYRRHARSIILELHKARSKNEVRHRDSIRHGSYLRGREEKVPVAVNDFNGKNDVANEKRRKYRQDNIEHERNAES